MNVSGQLPTPFAVDSAYRRARVFRLSSDAMYRLAMNSDLGRRIIELANVMDPVRRAALQREVFAPQYVLHPKNDPDVVGLDAYIERTSPVHYLDAMEFFLDDLIDTPEGFVMRYHWTAEYKGQPIGNNAIEINRVEDGLVVETWNAQDRLSVIEQISAIDRSASEA